MLQRKIKWYKVLGQIYFDQIYEPPTSFKIVSLKLDLLHETCRGRYFDRKKSSKMAASLEFIIPSFLPT